MSKEQKEKGPTVLDYSDGKYISGQPGKTVRDAIFEKVKRMEIAEASLLDQIARELGDDVKATAALLVALHSPEDLSSKAEWIRVACQSIVALQEERKAIHRIHRGMNNDIIYILSPVEMERFGL